MHLYAPIRNQAAPMKFVKGANTADATRVEAAGGRRALTGPPRRAPHAERRGAEDLLRARHLGVD